MMCKPTPFHFILGSMTVQSQTPQTCPVDSLTITSSYDSANVPYSASETNTSTQICRSWSVERKRKHALYTNQLARLNHDKALNLGVNFHRFPLHDCRRSCVSLLVQKGSARENKPDWMSTRIIYATGHIPFTQTGGVSAQIHELFMNYWHTYSPC